MSSTSHILARVSKLVFLFIMVYALHVFLKGHNEPGGGFIAGIVASIPLFLLAMTFDVKKIKSMLKIDSLTLAAIGLAIAYATAIVPAFIDLPFLFHKMVHVHIPLLGDVHTGTPALFDLGVFFVVIGISTKIIFEFLDTDFENEGKG